MVYVTGLGSAAIRSGHPPRRWLIYVRISEDREGAGLGEQRQETEIRQMIDRIDPGGIIVDVYCDNDLSAYSGKPRGDYLRMIEDIRSGRGNAIGAWHNDRLHRSPRELEDFIDLVEAFGVHVQTVRSGHLDLSTSSGRITARILGAVARGESELKAERLRSKHRQLAEAGKASGGGARPYGFRRIYDREEKPHRVIREELVPEEAVYIREWVRRALAEESVSSIVGDINAQGIVTSTGGRWSRTTLTRLLCSARIAGYREHRPRSRSATTRVVMGEITAKAEWPAIISLADSKRLRAMLGQPERRTNKGPNGKHLCSGGVLECPLCGARMVGRAKGTKHRRQYMCNSDKSTSSCGGISIDGEGVDGVVIAWVVTVLSNPGLRKSLERRGTSHGDDDVMLAEISACELELDELAADMGQRRITRREWMVARLPILARKEAAEATLGSADTVRVLAGVPADPDELAAFLRDLEVPVSRRRAVVFQVLNKVVVKPAVRGRHRFDPDRLVPDWKA